MSCTPKMVCVLRLHQHTLWCAVHTFFHCVQIWIAMDMDDQGYQLLIDEVMQSVKESETCTLKMKCV